MKKYLLFLLFSIFYSDLLIAQNFVWAKRIGDVTMDRANDITVDASGNVYTTGLFSGTVDFDPGPLVYTITSVGGRDIFVSKMDINGNFIWARGLGGTNFNMTFATDQGNSIKVDASGNVYTTGTFSGTVDFDSGPGTYTLSSTAGFSNDFFILKLDAAGNFVWARGIGGTSGEVSNSISIDVQGNVYATGWFGNTVDFDPGPATYAMSCSSFMESAFVLKLDVNGNFVWAKSVGGFSTSGSQGRAISYDPSGNIYICGWYQGIVDFDTGLGTFSLSSSPTMFGYDPDCFVMKLDVAGNFVWARGFGGPGYQYAKSLTVDATGDILTTGFGGGGITDFDPGPATYTINSGYVGFILKLDPLGNFVWARGTGLGVPPVGGAAPAFDIATDSFGNVITTGHYDKTVDFDPGPLTNTLSGNINGDGGDFILKLDAAGNFIWVKGIATNIYVNFDEVNATTIDVSGSIYVAGYFGATTDFDPGLLIYNLTSPSGGADAFILKLSCESPSTTAISGPTLICEGSSQIYSCSTTANTTGYIWSAFPGTTITAGATTVSVILNSGISSGTVAVAPINLCGSGSTTTLNVIVTLLPVINTQSTNQTALAGSNVQFTVGAQGQALTYQWQENSGSGFVNLNNTAPYSGVNTPTLTLSNVAMNLDNYSYRCVVESAGCQKESAAAILDVYNDVSVKKRNGENIFEIFPNPTSGFIKIQTSQYTNEFTFIISDQTGRKVLNGRVNSRETVIDISTLTNGLYFITLGEQNKPIKLVKQ